MPDTHRTVEALSPAARRWRVGLLLLAVLLALLSLWALLHAPRALDAARAGAYLLKPDAPDAQGWWGVSGLLPGSPLRDAGVQVGDRARFRHTTDVSGWRALDTLATDLHTAFNTCATPLNALAEAQLCPGAAALAKINAALR